MRSIQQEVSKTFEIQQYIGFFVVTGLELFTVYVWPAKIRPTMRDYYRGENKL